jgi:DNA-binding SARP family transcriptional activator
MSASATGNVSVGRAPDDVGGSRVQSSELLVGIFGDVQCWVEGRSVPHLTRMVKRVVAVLAGWPGSSVNRDRIVMALWGSSVPSDAHNSLQGHIATLRRSIGRDWIATNEDGYALLVQPEAVDTERFAALAERGLRDVHLGDHGLAHPLLMEARDLWRGTPFQDVEDAELVARRERLSELHERVREAILECRLNSVLSAYDAAEIVAWAKEEVARAPLRERRYEILMEALIRADRPAEAIDAYRMAEGFLRAHGGIRPGHGLIDAYQRAQAARADVLIPHGVRAASI